MVNQMILINNSDVLNKLCMLYIKSNSKPMIGQNKSMITITSKIEKVHANL